MVGINTPTPGPGTPTPTPGTLTSTPTSCPEVGPDLEIQKWHDGGDTFNAGSTITYQLQVLNREGNGPVNPGEPITVTNEIPADMINVHATGQGWKIKVNNRISPSTVQATYVSATPINGGVYLPRITVTGILTQADMPLLINGAEVETPRDRYDLNNRTWDQVMVVPPGQPTPVPPAPTTTPGPNTTSTPMPSPGSAPDLSIEKTHDGGEYFQVGRRVDSYLTIKNEDWAGPVNAGEPIIVTNTIPAGMSYITASGQGWQVTVDNSTSPTTVRATYSGAYPVAPGTVLPRVQVSGVVTAAARPVLIDGAEVSTPRDPNPYNDRDFDVIRVPFPPGPPPDLRIKISHKGNMMAFSVGDQITYQLQVSNGANAGPVYQGEPIMVLDSIPAGIRNIRAWGENWLVLIDKPTSPSRVMAIYDGPYPVMPGASLPPIRVRGTLIFSLHGNRKCGMDTSLTNTAWVYTQRDINVSNNKDTDTVKLKCMHPGNPTVVRDPHTPVIMAGQGIAKGALNGDGRRRSPGKR